jgi:hypothetical protein
MKAITAGAAFLVFFAPCADAITRYQIAVECKFDMDQYCKGIPKSRLRDLRECLAKHEKDLFPRCQDHYKEAQ